MQRACRPQSAAPRPRAVAPRSTVRIATINIASWRLHHSELFVLAAEEDLAVICLQEHGLSTEAIPGASNVARRAGWQLLARQSPPRGSGHHGGVAILARADAFALLADSSVRTGQGE
eukprot:10298857-Alexandrium_andersonii.AAC.1